MSLTTDLLDQDGLVIRVIRSGENVLITWFGICDAANPESTLGPFFRNLAGTLAGRNVVMDFRSFEYMNSASVTPILQFIKNLDQLNVKTTLRYDTTVSWQRVTYRCMKTICRTLTSLNVEDLPADK